jgi:hypothetical protein
VERAKSLFSVLDHRQSCTGCGAVTFKGAFAVLQQKHLVRCDLALDPTFADSHHLPEDGLVGCFRAIARGDGRLDCRSAPSQSALLATGDIRRHRSHHRQPGGLARSFFSPPWPAQAIRIARAAADPITLLVG